MTINIIYCRWWVSSPWTEAPKGFHAAGFFFFVPLAVTEYCVVLQPYLRVRVVKPEIKKYGSDIFMGLYAIFCFVFGVLSSEIVWKAYIEGRGDDGDAADAWISPPKFFLMFFFDAVICVLMHWAAKDHLSNEFVSEEVAETLNYLSWVQYLTLLVFKL